MSLALVAEARSTESAIPTMSGFDVGRKPGGRILIVDDSRLIRSVISSRLSAHYSCLQAESYSEAIEILRMYPFDLIIADVIMPGISGIELLRKVIEKYPETSVIMLSSIDLSQRAVDALRLGAFDYLIKPCELSVLELTVERALEHRQLILGAKRHKQDLEDRYAELVKSRGEVLRLQTQLIHSEKMIGLGQIAAGVAHELNNPVAFVHGNLEILHQTMASLKKILDFYESADLPDDVAAKAADLKSRARYISAADDLDEIFTDCREGTERIRDIVQNLRTFSRRDEAEFKKADVNAGIDSTVRLLSQYFSGGNITLERDYDDVPLIDALGSQMNQVWMNLLVNAAQAIGTVQGHVRITTRSEGEFVTVTIADTGDGIAEHRLGRIFDPFYTTKSVGEGTGLGLSISFGIVETHGGTMLAVSELGAGAAFTVRLPIKMKRRRETAETAMAIFEPIKNPTLEFHHEIQNSYCR